MFFEGMVKVSKEDIGKFLEIWKFNVEIYNEAVRMFNLDKEQFYNNLPWWKKIFYDKEDFSDFHKVSGFQGGKYKDLCTIMVEMGYLPDCDRWRILYYNEHCYLQIVGLFWAGSDIYLTPDQSHLMATVLKMEEL